MKCFSCGAEVREHDRYCAYCGREQVPTSTVSTRAPEIHIHNHYEEKTSAQPVRVVERVVERVVVKPTRSQRSRIVLLLLFLFLGYVGAHKFYAGRFLMGIVYVLTFGLLGMGLVFDFFSILLGNPRDGDGLPILW